ILVKIDSSRSDGIFRVGAIREFTTALKECTRAMCLDHRLQQELDDFRMQIAANQYLGGSPYERDVILRDVTVISMTPRGSTSRTSSGKIMVRASAVAKFIIRTLGSCSKERTAGESGVPRIQTASTLPSINASTAADPPKGKNVEFSEFRPALPRIFSA